MRLLHFRGTAAVSVIKCRARLLYYSFTAASLLLHFAVNINFRRAMSESDESEYRAVAGSAISVRLARGGKKKGGPGAFLLPVPDEDSFPHRFVFIRHVVTITKLN